MLPTSEEFARAYKNHRRRQKGFAILAAVVVFCTVYALVLPAVTLEKTCLVEEHTHTRECYTQITSVSVTKLQCTAQAHSHNADCGSSCGYADYFIHTHDSSCYDAQGQLCCPLPQIREHIHGEECYYVPEGHTHTEDCYARQQGELICDLPQEEGHTHGEECLDEEGNLICQLEECPGHTHGEECYNWTEALTCPLQEEPAGEPVLICQQPQIQAHQHDSTCAEGHNCQMTEVLVHTHGPECFVTVEEPVDTQTLTCGNTDPEHVHTDLCYGTWELTCGLEEHTHSDSCFQSEEPEDVPTRETLTSVVTLETPAEETPEEPDGETGEPLAVENYITGAKLYYSTDGSTWTQIVDNMEETVPGNATFKLEVAFEKVSPDNLRAAGYQMTYRMPELLKDAQAVGNLMVGTETKGIISVKDGVATLTFDSTWVDKLDVISGNFEVRGRADLSVAATPGGNKIQVGGVTITIPFEDNLIAHYGDVELEKTLVELEETDQGRFLHYTLTVTAGSDGCHDSVVVQDRITGGGECIQKKEDGTYDIRLEEETENVQLTEQGFNWTLGKLVANESRSLTYKLLLTEEYLGADTRNSPKITNTATVYSGEYKRDEDAAIFEPNGRINMSKTSASFQKNENDDGGILRYTVWVYAYEDNNYTFDNLYIRDSLDGTVPGNVKTDEALLPFLSYGKFTLYEGGRQGQNGADGLKAAENAGEVQIAENGKSFKFPIGDLKRGESKTLVYEVKVDQGIFTTGNMDLKIGNRVEVLSDPSRDNGGNVRLQSFFHWHTLTGKTWVWKQEGKKVTEAQTISMGESSFTVPAGSYLYEVGVNETGNWDVSGAQLVDQLVGQYMAYVGYVKVEAYPKVDGKKADTPSDIKWIDIDGKTSFTIIPTEIGLPKGDYAYRLTYYAYPQNLENASTVEVVNEFHLEGKVIGVGNVEYTIGGVWVSATVRVEGQNAFHAAKRFWYYDPNEGERGAMYWIIEAQGNRIPSGTKFRDSIDQAKTGHTISGVVRAFTGALEELSQYADLSQLPTVTEFTGYKPELANNTLTLTLTKDVTLGSGETLYFIVKTTPNTLPASKGQYLTYGNDLETQDPGEDTLWTSQTGDQHTISGGGDIYKTLAAVFQAKADSNNEITASTVEFKQNDNQTKLQYDHLTAAGPGVYAAWKVTINRDSTLSGSYRIQEQIPTGMELVYVQRYSTGQKYGSRPTFGQISDLEGFTLVQKDFSSAYDKNPSPAYLYVKGQEVIWQVDGLVADYKNPGDYYATYLVVCKVTDPDVLQGGEEKTFDNRVALLTEAGESMANDVSSVTLGAPKLSKTGTYDDTKGSTYPFEIRVNELGTDLVPGADTIVLKDTMCDILTLDVDTIQVINTTTGETVTNWTAQVDGQTLSLTLPDDLPLTITYSTTIHAKPGEPINISNNAHWFGYSSTPDSSVSEENFQYSAGGSLVGTNYISVDIQKRDRGDTKKLLAGATFELVEVDEKLNPVQGFAAREGTTDESGKCQFTQLDFNTIYRLKETVAPDGYVLDGTSHYFMVCKEDENGNYPAVPDGVNAVYGTDTYTYQAFNGKGEVAVEKKFQNAAGKELSGAISGTYRFALYETEQTAGSAATPKQTITHVYAPDGSVQTEKFTGLEVGKTYYVYELDDSGAPILPGNEGIASAMPFVVSYENNAVKVEEQLTTVKVTNRMNYQQLPSTGGNGIFGIWLLGVVLILSGGVMLDRRNKLRMGQ